MDKYVAYDAQNNETETFETIEAAQEWLKNYNAYEDGIDKEVEQGYSFIAKIIYRTGYLTIDRKENYHIHTENCPINCDQETWPYSVEYDEVGEIVFKEVD